MTESNLPLLSAITSRKSVRLFGILALAAAAFAVVLVLNEMRGPTVVGVSGDADVLHARLDNMESRLHALEDRAAHEPAAAPAIVAPVPVLGDEDSAALQHAQSDIKALSAAMAALQTEMKATGATVAEARDSAAQLVAAAMAFIQLRDVAGAGRPFSVELAVLRDAAKNDSVLLAVAAKIEPYAVSGAPTLAALRDELMQRQPAVAVAVAKGSAQHWWERLFAELQGLVTVRPLHGGEGDNLASVEAALARGNAADAVAAYRELPKDAQTNLADWDKRLESRQALDDGLADMGRRFTAPPSPKG